MISTAPPVVLRFSKDERRVFQQNLYVMSDPVVAYTNKHAPRTRPFSEHWTLNFERLLSCNGLNGAQRLNGWNVWNSRKRW